MSIFQAGWPCRCLEAEWAWVTHWGVDTKADWRSAVKLQEALHFLRIEETRYRPLPLRPIWPGFAVNTISYAAALWFLVRGPFVLRRYVRVKRHLCPACGYPVGVSAVCTECGRAVSPRAESSEPESSHVPLD